MINGLILIHPVFQSIRKYFPLKWEGNPKKRGKICIYVCVCIYIYIYIIIIYSCMYIADSLRCSVETNIPL